MFAVSAWCRLHREQVFVNKSSQARATTSRLTMSNGLSSKRDSELPIIDDSLVPSRRLVTRAVSLTIGIAVLVIIATLLVSFVVVINVTIDVDGTIEPLEIWPVRSREAGILDTVLVASGDTVRRGQVVATLDSLDAGANVRKLRATLEESRTDLQLAVASAPFNANQQVERIAQAETQVLQAKAALRGRLVEYSLKANVDSVLRAYVPGRSVNVDLAIATVEAAEAAVRAARAQRNLTSLDSLDLKKRRRELVRMNGDIALATLQQQRLRILAPSDGIVLTEQLERLPGAYVQAGEQLMEIANSRRWRAIFLVRDHDVHDIRTGDRATLEIAALKGLNGRELRGRVASVAAQPISDNSSVNAAQGQGGGASYRVIVALDRAQLDSIGVAEFRRGYVVRGSIITRTGRIASIVRDYVREDLQAIR